MAKRIMIQGTMSGAGKSLICAALCRIFRQDGFRTAPFKSQNMALNSFVTRDGGEMGRAQVLQAQAAGKEPDVRMNPILLKPSGDMDSQVIVSGRVYGNYSAAEYFKMKKDLIPEILSAYESLASENDIIVIEGAGSPAEINLKKDDIVNMGLAEMVGSPVILAGNIDPGGVFAQLYGTMALLEERERERIIGTLINRFRGDEAILRPGLSMLEDLTKVPVLGVIPYIDLDLDDEDSLSPRFEKTENERAVDIAAIRLPHISNFTDLAPLEAHPALGVRYVNRADRLGDPDMIILPGSKNTIGDLLWLRETGLYNLIRQKAEEGTSLLGICGGYQMLCGSISDPAGTEHEGEAEGLGLLPGRTFFSEEKIQKQSNAVVQAAPFRGVRITGYQIHMGRTIVKDPESFREGETGFSKTEALGSFCMNGAEPFCILEDGTPDGCVCGSVFGTYLHGLFDSGELVSSLALYLTGRKGTACPDYDPESHTARQEKELDRLADVVREHIDLEMIYRAMEEYENG